MPDCKENFLAYNNVHQPGGFVEYVAFCPLWFNTVPVNDLECSYGDKAATLVHELSHTMLLRASGGSKGMLDKYGSINILELSSEEALENAESFARFSKGKFHSRTQRDMDRLTCLLSSGAQQMLSLDQLSINRSDRRQRTNTTDWRHKALVQ
jgi:hypothetical protein